MGRFAKNIIEFDRVSFRYQSVPVLDNITLAVREGEFLGLVGPNGGGKSTLIKLIMGLITPDSGTVKVFGTSVKKARSRLGYVPQFARFPSDFPITVEETVLMGCLHQGRLLQRYTKKDRELARKCMEETGVAEFADRSIDQLSGGQRQRVAIARCLAQEPELILADEPVSNLDPAHAERILELITNTARNRGIAVVFSSHQPELSRRFADRIVGLRAGAVLFDKPSAMVGNDDISDLYHGTVPGDGLRVVS